MINIGSIRATRPAALGTEMILMDGERAVIPTGPDVVVMEGVQSGEPVKVRTLASTCSEEQAVALCGDLVLLGAAEKVR